MKDVCDQHGSRLAIDYIFVDLISYLAPVVLAW